MLLSNVAALIRKTSERDMKDPAVLIDMFELLRLYEKENFQQAHRLNGQLYTIAEREAVRQKSVAMYEIARRSLLFDAPHFLHAAILYAEWDRPPQSKFYVNRHKQLRPVVDAMQMLEERKIHLLGVMAPPGVGKSSLAIFYMLWSGLRNPKLSIMGCSHNNDFLKQVYGEMVAMLDPKGEYRWHDIFPNIPDIQTDAKSFRINIGDPKRFDTFEFASIKSGIAGRMRASNLLYVDDLVEGSEEAFSRERMKTLWSKYTVDLLQRQQGDCAQLIIQTPWSVHDPIDQVELRHREDPDAMFIHLPAMDESDESNFDYPYNLGFTTEKYREIRSTMDEISWSSLYMTHAKEREGLLYDSDNLRKYSELPAGTPDAILAVCDTKDKGKDYAVMVIAYKYKDDYYIEDFVCDNGRLEVIDAKLTSMLIRHEVQIARFESNAAGGRVAEKIQEDVRAAGGFTKIEVKYTSENKETKIYVQSMFATEHFLFNEEKWRTEKEYRVAMEFLCSYTLLGKNVHDDVPDAIAMLSEFVQGLAGAKAKIGFRPY